MKHCYIQTRQTTRRNLLIACATALAVAFTASPPQPAHAGHVAPPAVPANLQAPAGHKVFFVGHAVGAQQYICLFPGTDAPWAFFGPQATLFDDGDKQVSTHFLSTNPFEINMPSRPTWQHSKDTSTVWAATPPVASSSDPQFVAPSAIPWLLLEVAGAQDGPTGGHKLTATTFIQRLNTSGGIAPSTDCTFGEKKLAPYEADYFFYKAAKRGADDDN